MFIEVTKVDENGDTSPRLVNFDYVVKVDKADSNENNPNVNSKITFKIADDGQRYLSYVMPIVETYEEIKRKLGIGGARV